MTPAQVAAYVEQAMVWLRDHQSVTLVTFPPATTQNTQIVFQALLNPANLAGLLHLLPANTPGLAQTLTVPMSTIAAYAEQIAASCNGDVGVLVKEILAHFG
jgi:hypothetical protein